MYVIMVVIAFEHKHNTILHVQASVLEALPLIPQVAISSTFFYYLIRFLSNKICCDHRACNFLQEISFLQEFNFEKVLIPYFV